jgi:hypothetical protein
LEENGTSNVGYLTSRAKQIRREKAKEKMETPHNFLFG